MPSGTCPASPHSKTHVHHPALRVSTAGHGEGHGGPCGGADERLGHALVDLRTAVLAVKTGRTCPAADEKGCC